MILSVVGWIKTFFLALCFELSFPIYSFYSAYLSLFSSLSLYLSRYLVNSSIDIPIYFSIINGIFSMFPLHFSLSLFNYTPIYMIIYTHIFTSEKED